MRNLALFILLTLSSLQSAHAQQAPSIANSTVYWSIEWGGCSGVFIAADAILTAAHCLQDAGQQGPLSITFFDGKTPRPTIEVEQSEYKTFIHEEYNRKVPGSENFDLGVIVISKKVIPSGYAAAEFFTAADAKLIAKGVSATIGGTGSTSSKLGDNEIALRAVQAHLVRFGKRSVEFATNKGSVICHGDSGGPIFKSVNGKLKLFGIMSLAYFYKKIQHCSNERAATYIDENNHAWITEQIWLGQKSLDPRL